MGDSYVHGVMAVGDFCAMPTLKNYVNLHNVGQEPAIVAYHISGCPFWSQWFVHLNIDAIRFITKMIPILHFNLGCFSVLHAFLLYFAV